MQRIRKNDTVEVIKGKDAGKRGRVLQLFFARKKAIVEGINMVKKHRRAARQDQAQQAGIISIESPIAWENVMLVCKTCNVPRRVGFSVGADAQKSRICKTCKEVL